MKPLQNMGRLTTEAVEEMHKAGLIERFTDQYGQSLWMLTEKGRIYREVLDSVWSGLR